MPVSRTSGPAIDSYARAGELHPANGRDLRQKGAIQEIPFNAESPRVVLAGVMNFLRLVRPAPTQAQPLSGRDDDALMTLVQAGSRDAFAMLVERHALRVVRTCARFMGERDQASDLAQGIWVTVWKSRARYQPGSEFLTWLITIARNRCRNELRRQGAVDRHVQKELASGTDHSPEQLDSLLQQERHRRVHQALYRLPEAMRDALIMRYGEELRYDEMSEVLGAHESTLRSRVHNGLKLLKRQLEKNP